MLAALSALGAVFNASAADAAPAKADAPTTSPDKADELGDFADRAGTWTVQATVWESAGAAPSVTKGFVAERRIVGPYLEEVMTAEAGTSTPDFRRLAYLRHFVEQDRWQYVTLDGRFPVGVLPAWSTESESSGTLTFQYAQPGFDGLGDLIEQRVVGAKAVLIRDGKDHDIAQQYWIDAKTGTSWLGLQYDYRRRT